MDWFKVFYWVTVADNIKDFFDAFSNIFTFLSIIFALVYVGTSIALAGEKSKTYKDNDGKDYHSDPGTVNSLQVWSKVSGRVFYFSAIFCLLTWFGYMACPSKKDALIIIAGGAVGNFITSDSSAKHIPAEAMVLLRDKIRNEINELNVQKPLDTLTTKSKEELIKMIQARK